MRVIFSLVIALALAGCFRSTPAELEAVPIAQIYPDSYQEIYRRVSTTAKRCFAAPLGLSAMVVDSELYSELGYGELTLSIAGPGTRDYYLSLRVEKQPTGSKLTIRSANNSAGEQQRSRVLSWAGGNQNCQ